MPGHSDGQVGVILRPNMFMQNIVTVHGESIRKESAFYESAEGARVKSCRDYAPELTAE
jgi:hypothetical protein